MFIKQIDRAEAFRLANTGMEVAVLIPGPDGSEWEEASTTTLSKLLEGCAFFRREVAMVNPDFEAAVQEVPTKKLSEKVEAKPKVQTKKVDIGKIMALYEAGWTMAKIGEEMKMTNKTVWYYINKARKERENAKA